MPTIIIGNDNFDSADNATQTALDALSSDNRIATAWVNFDGSSAVGVDCTIRDSYNVDRVEHTNSGQYVVYFSIAMDNINYSVASTNDYHGISDIELPTVNSFRITNYSTSTTSPDTSVVYAQVFGGKA